MGGKNFSKIQKIWFRYRERSFPIGKNGSSESYILEKEIFLFQEKIENNANNSKELWKALKSMGMKSGKLNQKLLRKMMVVFNLNLRKMQIFLKHFYSDLARKLVTKLPVHLTI